MTDNLVLFQDLPGYIVCISFKPVFIQMGGFNLSSCYSSFLHNDANVWITRVKKNEMEVDYVCGSFFRTKSISH